MTDALPPDPDVLPSAPRALGAAALGVVFLGGAAGTLARFGVGLALPPWQGVPVATLAVNIVGAFLLGLLVEVVVRRGAARWPRLLLGTGFLGGFTTYSALAVDTQGLWAAGPGMALLYAGATLLGGAAATWAGILLGRRVPRREGAS